MTSAEALKTILTRTKNPELMADCLENVIKNSAPMALYKCADTIDKVEWIFDKEYILEVIGGEQIYSNLLEEQKPPGDYVVIFIFKKVGPLIPMFVEERIVAEALEELRNNLKSS